MSVGTYNRTLAALALPVSLGLASCAQLLGLGEYKEGAGVGGSGGVAGPAGPGPASGTGSATGTSSGTGGMGPAPGEVLWAHSFGDATDQEASRVAVSPNGQIYVVVRGGTETLTGLDPQGNVLWSSSEPFGNIYGVAADDTGVVVAGMNQQSVNFSNGPELGFYFAKVDPMGHLLWVSACGGFLAEPLFDRSGDVVIDAMGRATFVGTVAQIGCGSTSFNGIVGLRALPDGTVSRGLTIGNTAYTATAGVAGNAQGNIAFGIPFGTVNVGFMNRIAPLVTKFTDYSDSSFAFAQPLPASTNSLAFDKSV